MQGANSEDTEKALLAEVKKEIEKLKYYLEESDEIIEEGDFVEIEVTHNRTTAIHNKLCNLIAQVQELKIERGIEIARAIRQCKKDTKERFAPWTLTADGKDRKRHQSETKGNLRRNRPRESPRTECERFTPSRRVA